jgi:hypothetical protein
MGRQGTYKAEAVKDLHGGKALLPEALVVFEAGDRVADGLPRHVQQGHVRHQRRHLWCADAAQPCTSEHDSRAQSSGGLASATTERTHRGRQACPPGALASRLHPTPRSRAARAPHSRRCRYSCCRSRARERGRQWCPCCRRPTRSPS